MARRTERRGTRSLNRLMVLVAGGMLAVFGFAGGVLAQDAAVQFDTSSPGELTGAVTIPSPCGGNEEPPCTDTFEIDLAVGTESKRALVVGVALNNSFSNGWSIAGMTWEVGSTSETLTRVQGSDNTVHTRRVEQWDYLEQASGDGTIIVTVQGPAGGSTAWVAGAISLWNVTTRGPNSCDTPQSGQEDSYPFRSLSRTYIRNGDVDFLAVEGDNNASPDSPQTERWWAWTGTGDSTDLLGAGSTQPGLANATNFSWVLDYDSSWVICAVDYRPYEPTLAEVTEYSAVPTARGTLIRWQTAYEFDNLGFRVLRENADGSRTAVTPSLIAGSALFAGRGMPLSAGRSYQWLDASASRGSTATYWLEEVSLSGNSAFHGPISAPATVSALGTSFLAPEVEDNSRLLGALGSRPAATQASVASSRAVRRIVPSTWSAQAAQWRLASTAAAKMAVRGEGWYSVSKSELLAAAFDPGDDPAALRLFVQGAEVAIGVNDGGDGHFDAVDAIEFYGTGQDTPYTDARTYWLVRDFEAAQPPLRIAQAAATQGGAGPTTYEATVERKDRTVYFAALMDPTRDNFFGPVIADQPVEQALAVDHVAQGAGATGALQVVLQGATTIAHRVGVALNGHDLGEIAFTGVTNAQSTFSFDLSWLNEGTNTVRLVGLGGSSDVSLVDTLRLTFPRAPFATGDRVLLSAAPLVSTTVQGFTDAHIRALDVTRPGAVVELPVVVASSAGVFSATFTALDQAEVFAFTEAQTLRPDSITANGPSNWHGGSHRADLVIVTHPDFAQAAQRLAALRVQRGLATEVVSIEDVYDEFSFGAKDPQAIRNLLARSTAQWQQAPRFVLLFGDATMDPRDYLEQGAADFVPTKMVPLEVLKSASDDWFVDFADTGMPQMGVGRIPVRTRAEADAVVSKLEAYEAAAAGADWTKKAVFVADADDDDLRVKFTDATRSIEGHVPAGVAPSEIFSGTLGQAEARTQAINAINSGALVVNYVGHGSDTGWAGGGQLFSAADAMALSNGAKLPAVVALNCLNGLFEGTTGDSLAEAFLKAPNGGAVAVLASSALTEVEGQTELGTRFFDAALGSRLAVGEALMVAKAAEVRNGVRRSFLLFGDPSMKLKQ
jgi:hypothetical protein